MVNDMVDEMVMKMNSMAVLYYMRELVIRFNFILFGTLLAFTGVFSYREEFLVLFARPYWDSIRQGSLIFTGMGEVFQTYLGLALVGSLCVLLYSLIVNVYLFLLPGLYRYERRFLTKGLFWGSICLGAGFLIIHGYIVQLVCSYLVDYGLLLGNSGLELRFEPRLLEFVKFVLRLDLVFSLVFVGLSLYFSYLRLKENSVEEIRWLRQWVYLSFVLMIIVVLPADFVLHLIVLLFLVVCCEVLIFVLLLLKNYEFAWWNW